MLKKTLSLFILITLILTQANAFAVEKIPGPKVLNIKVDNLSEIFKAIGNDIVLFEGSAFAFVDGKRIKLSKQVLKKNNDILVSGDIFDTDSKDMLTLNEIGEIRKKTVVIDESGLIIIGDKDIIDKIGLLKDKLIKTFGLFISTSTKNNKNKKIYSGIESAKAEVSDMKHSTGLPIGGLDIYIMGGTYTCKNTIKFSESDSGCEMAPISYVAYDNQSVSFSGAEIIDGGKFRAVTDKSILARLYPKVRDKVKQIKLLDIGITDVGNITRTNPWTRTEPDSVSLYLNDSKQTIARWPNFEYAKTGTVVTTGSNTVPSAWNFEESTPKRWAEADNIYMQGYWAWDWYDDTIKVKEIDFEKNIIYGSEETMTVYGVSRGKRYYAFNILEEIDTPGEWFVDKNTNILYYYPATNDLANSTLELTSFQKIMLEITATQHITFSGLTFKNSTNGAVNFNDASFVRFEGCTFKNLGSAVATLTGGFNSGFYGCDFYNTSKGGVFFLKVGDIETLTPSNHYVENCYFSRFNTVAKTYAPAVLLEEDGVVGVKIKNNTIHDGPHEGIGYSGNNNIIDHNEMYDLLNETTDAGAIYGGRATTIFGNMITNNLIHDVYDTHGGSGAHGVYFDDRQAGGNVLNNIFYNMTSGVLINGGRYNKVKNNVFVNCGIPYQVIKQDGLTTDTENVVSSGTLWESYNKRPVKNDYWTKQFPELATFFDKPFWWTAQTNTLRDNVLFNSGERIYPENATLNSDIADDVLVKNEDYFVDSDNFDYTFKNETPFELPKMSEIGIRVDDIRTKTPEIMDYVAINPLNNSKNVDAYNLYLTWQPAIGATYYRVKVAKDKDFKDLVFNEKVQDERVMLQGLQFGNVKYYWYVEAYSKSALIMKEKKLITGGIQSFTTANNEIVAKDKLLEVYSKSQLLQKKAIVGEKVGNHKKEDIEALENILKSTEEVLKSKKVSQKQVDEKVDELSAKSEVFISQTIVGNVDLLEYLKDTSNWTCENINERIMGDNSLTYVGQGKFGYKFPMPKHAILTFKVRFTFGTNWQGIGIREADPVTPGWGTYGYIFGMNGGYQRFYNGYKDAPSGKENPIKDKTIHLIEIGATDIPGGVHLIFKVDGITYLDADETDGAIPYAGAFTIYNYGTGAKVELFGADYTE